MTARFSTAESVEARAPLPAVSRSSERSVLDDWPREPVPLAVWERSLPAGLTAAARAVAAGPGSLEQRFSWHADDTDRALAGYLSPFGVGSPDHRRAMLADLRMLLDLAVGIARAVCRDVRPIALPVRLERVTGDGCRLFHVDRLGARLICTLAGAGSEWLPEGAFDRAGLGCGCNDHVSDPAAIQTLPTGAVALMRGDLYPEFPGAGLVHRSPPATPDTPRFLVAVDLPG